MMITDLFRSGAITAGRAVLDLALPSHCPSCDRIVEAEGRFCRDCFAAARFVLDPCCTGCAVPFSSRELAGQRRICDGCAAAPPGWDEARAAFVYDAFSRGLILPLKYADRTENARVLGRHMARAAASLLDRTDLVLPVPLHRLRLLGRRYNQAALLAREMLRGRSGGPVLLPDGLCRHRATRALASQGAASRAIELEGAISVRPRAASRIAGRRIVLVDDVLTTGSTARACTEILRGAGAKSVALVVAARTVLAA